jgi:hypothetical protein
MDDGPTMPTAYGLPARGVSAPVAELTEKTHTPAGLVALRDITASRR